MPARCDVVGPQSTRRPALLVDVWLQLLGIDEMAPAALQRERARWVPGEADRGRIKRPGFDVPAMLVRLAPVEAADLDLHAIEHHPGGDHAEADVRGIEPVMRDRRF